MIMTQTVCLCLASALSLGEKNLPIGEDQHALPSLPAHTPWVFQVGSEVVPGALGGWWPVSESSIHDVASLTPRFPD